MAVVNAMIERRAREVVQVLSRHARVRAAYVFGSQTTGTADRWSDLDIAAFIEDTDQWDMRRCARLAASVQKEVGDDIELHFFAAKDLENPPPASFAAYVLGHGVRIMPED